MKFNELLAKPSGILKNFTKNNKIIFLDPNNPDANTISDKEKIDVILSPSLYWVKKVTLPIKYVRDVKKLLPSLFEEILPDGSYSYSVYKEDDEFFIFAYEDKLILDTFLSAGISSSDVAGVYFAQSELGYIDGAVNINETQSIYVQDDMVVLVPCCWIEETGDLNLEDVILSKHKIALQHYAHIVDNSSLYKIAIVLVFLVVLLLSEITITSNNTADLLEQNDEIFASYKLKPTMMQNKSMLKKYKKIHTKQSKIREHISSILKFRLQGSERLSELDVKNSTLSAKYSGASTATLSRIKNVFKSKKIKHKLYMQDKILHLEVQL